MSELFRFEVPTSEGVFVVIGPDTLPPDEAERIGKRIAELIPLMVLTPEDATRPDPATTNPRLIEAELVVPAPAGLDVEACLAELAESPLPGARYAYEVVARRLRAATRPAPAGLDVDVLADAIENYLRSAKSDPSPWARNPEDMAADLADLAAEYARAAPAPAGLDDGSDPWGDVWDALDRLVPAYPEDDDDMGEIRRIVSQRQDARAATRPAEDAER